MSDVTSSVEAIEARLDAATPGPWEVNRDGPDDMAWVMGQYDELADAHAEVTDYLLFADADLIANAPSDLRHLLDELKRARDLLVFADGLAVSESGHSLADLYAEDCEWAQAALRDAGCHPRGSIKGGWEHSLADDDKSCSCGWAGEDGQVHMSEVLAAMAEESS